MPKRQKGPKNFKNDGSVDDPVHIQLSYVLHCRDSPLVELEDVFLHVNANIFQDLVNDRDTEFRMPSLKIKDEICELRNITKLDLPNICKSREDKAVDLKRLKVRGCAKQLDSNALSLSLLPLDLPNATFSAALTPCRAFVSSTLHQGGAG